MIEVSIIIATYNVAPYIQRAIASALAQDSVNLEVIVVDDCSTDTTWDVVLAIHDPRLRTRRNHKNCGPSATRNEAIAMANGKWIAVLDGDDEFLPGRLSRILANASGADIVVDNIEVRRESDGAVFPMFAPSRFAYGSLGLAAFISGNHLFSKTHTLGYLKPVFSAEFLRSHQLSYAPDLRIGEDYLLLAEALALGAVCVTLPDAGYAYTVRAGSISHRLALADIERMQQSDRKFLAKHKLDRAAAKAQSRRTKSLRAGYDFTRLVDALKCKDAMLACRIALTHPKSVFYLWMPIAARIKRLIRS